MLLNLSDILSYEEKREERQIPYEADTFESGGVNYQIKEKSPLTLVLEAETKGSVLLSGTLDVILLIDCNRCLMEVEVPLHLSITESVTKEDTQLKPSEQEKSFLEGYYIDTEKLIHNEILMNLPMKVLCKEDCKGICKVCGKDLNLGTCDCDDFVPDPRMAIINDIFYGNKEV